MKNAAPEIKFNGKHVFLHDNDSIMNFDLGV